MNYSMKTVDGNHVVDMTPAEPSNEPTETILEVLKCMTGYKVAEILSEDMKDADLSKLITTEVDASQLTIETIDASQLWRTNK